MVAESSRQFEALQAQAPALLEVFTGAGYELVAPAMLQPADLFLDRMGEAIRGRTYVFTDIGGRELCLRPDLTVPVCRLYLERHPEADREARYCYNGPAFRYQPDGEDLTRPREFRQAGLEYIGAEDREQAETEVLSLAVQAVRSAGLDGFRIHLGDLGLFGALIAALDIPERWRLRLRHFFWRPQAFHDLLHALAAKSGRTSGKVSPALMNKLDPDDPEEAEALVAAYLKRARVPLQGTRSAAEITERLLDQVADAREARLPKRTADLIEDYLAVSGPPRAALARIDDLVSAARLDLSAELDTFRRRLDLFSEAGLDLAGMTFSAEFGRQLEYYSGLVFQIELPDSGRAGQIAGGGRYDSLIRELGAPRDVPAVGCAIHTERLLAATGGGRA